ncbi:SH2 domain-containing protein 4A isoform X2 [Dunckerocampus dactyliophorus]|uniref:SH2 domain-containing protein 4A isoform X2 n=1 Tax=Dunckerocampus dactyliophorus TaxID=161453 RepID=UPI002404D18E|nr:SH2 domain-containing protein 4A isoform X2 [Dunckerocampus dactyliophorus]
MLQQILKDMYIDPDVLEALNEDQKKTLFLKMRQEQVRRWKEREEKVEKEGGDAENKRTKPKKANSKNVSWLLGRDGDVAVIVIGEVDELTSKFICSGLGEKKAPSAQNNTVNQTILKSRKNTEVTTERENVPCQTQPEISLNLKGKCEKESTLLPLPVSVSEHSSASSTAQKQEEESSSGIEEKPVSQPSINPKLPRRTNAVIVRPASANVAPGPINARQGVTNLRQVVTAPALPLPSGVVKADCGTTSASKGALQSQGPAKIKEPQQAKVSTSNLPDRAASLKVGSSGTTPSNAGRGRVAQLMKTFSIDNVPTPTHTPSRGVKPPLPTKPSHLCVASTPSVR